MSTVASRKSSWISTGSSDKSAEKGPSSDIKGASIRIGVPVHVKAKVSLFRNYMTQRECLYGQKCLFAHGLSDLQYNTIYKTKLCNQFTKKNHCFYGQRCNFVHSLKSPPLPTSGQYRQIIYSGRTAARSYVLNIIQNKL